MLSPGISPQCNPVSSSANENEVHIINNNNNWNLYSAISIHKMLKSAAHCHSLSHSQERLNGRA